MNWSIFAGIGYKIAYKIFAAWVKKTQPVEALKEIMAVAASMDITSAEKREYVWDEAARILGREWRETLGFVKDHAFAIAYQEFKEKI